MKDDRTQLLEKIRLQRSGVSPATVAYQNFMPATLKTQVRNSPYNELALQGIRETGETASDIARVKRYNTDTYDFMKTREDALAAARRRLRRAKRAPVTTIPYYVPNPVGGGGGKGPTGAFKGFGKNFNPNALTSFKWRGHTLHVNPVAVKAFRGLLNDLYKAGYRPKVIGSHNDRNIAGTNMPSLHSYGLAIDIDPAQNPVTYNGRNQTILPKNVGAIARKWGLSWGGNWRSYKDPMHFSIPYKGRE